MALAGPQDARGEGPRDASGRPGGGQKGPCPPSVLVIFVPEPGGQEGLLEGDDEKAVDDEKGDREQGGGPRPGHQPPSQPDQAVAEVEGVAHEGVGSPGDQPLRADGLPPVASDAADGPEPPGLPQDDEGKPQEDGPQGRPGQEQDHQEEDRPDPAPELKDFLTKRLHSTNLVWPHPWPPPRGRRPGGAPRRRPIPTSESRRRPP